MRGRAGEKGRILDIKDIHFKSVYFQKPSLLGYGVNHYGVRGKGGKVRVTHIVIFPICVVYIIPSTE